MIGPDSLALRASDAERERAVSQLHEHCAAGRLTADELDQRSDAAFAARTIGELQALLADLPALPARPPARRGHPDPARERAKKRVLHAAGTWALISLLCLGIWVATGVDSAFWPRWILLVAAVRVAFVAWGELGPGADEQRKRLGRGGSAEPGHAAREQRDPR